MVVPEAAGATATLEQTRRTKAFAVELDWVIDEPPTASVSAVGSGWLVTEAALAPSVFAVGLGLLVTVEDLAPWLSCMTCTSTESVVSVV